MAGQPWSLTCLWHGRSIADQFGQSTGDTEAGSGKRWGLQRIVRWLQDLRDFTSLPLTLSGLQRPDSRTGPTPDAGADRPYWREQCELSAEAHPICWHAKQLVCKSFSDHRVHRQSCISVASYTRLLQTCKAQLTDHIPICSPCLSSMCA